MLLLLSLLPSTPHGLELVQNGGFEDLPGGDWPAGWDAQGCWLSAETWDVHTGGHSLHVSSRTADWSGPLQNLYLPDMEDYSEGILSFAIKLHAGDSLDYSWTLRTSGDQGDNYHHLYDGAVQAGQDWQQISVSVSFPQFVAVRSVQLYMEGAPAAAEPLLDAVSLTVDGEAHTTQSGSWEERANQRIEQIRKRNLTVEFAAGGEGSNSGAHPAPPPLSLRNRS